MDLVAVIGHVRKRGSGLEEDTMAAAVVKCDDAADPKSELKGEVLDDERRNQRAAVV